MSTARLPLVRMRVAGRCHHRTAGRVGIVRLPARSVAVTSCAHAPLRVEKGVPLPAKMTGAGSGEATTPASSGRKANPQEESEAGHRVGMTRLGGTLAPGARKAGMNGLADPKGKVAEARRDGAIIEVDQKVYGTWAILCRELPSPTSSDHSELACLPAFFRGVRSPDITVVSVSSCTCSVCYSRA